MRILFISDIHGITTNLHIIKEEKFDKLVVLGDLYYTGLNSNYTNKDINILYVKELLEEYKDKLICLRGNCDSDVDIKASDFPICNNLTLIHTDNIDIYCTHGNEYSSEKNRKFDGVKGVLIYGHEHTPYIKKDNNMIYINVGSISLPRNSSGPSYCIYEDRTFTIYNIDKEVIDKVEVL